MEINCDIGERGISNQTDLELMKYIDIANIACGGHAGDKESSEFFSNLAIKYSKKISAHLSYPDKDNFGRMSIIIANKTLIDSLNKQLDLLKSTSIVKFHGALYNDSCANIDLAITLANWLKKRDIKAVLTLPDSELAIQCKLKGINIKNEAFIERRYEYNHVNKRLNLRSRKYPDASIKGIAEAIDQFKDFFYKKKVYAINSISERGSYISINADTLCIHSDSEIALPLVKKIRNILKDEN